MAQKTTKEAVRVNQAVPAVPALRVLHVGGAEVRCRPPIALAAPVIPIGREVPRGGISLEEDPRVSRIHAHLHLAGPTDLRIVDAGSRNGTFVNGGPIHMSPLHEGDVIRVGDSFLLVRYQSAREVPDEEEVPIGGMLGVSPAITALRDNIRLVAPTRATVLLLGESGVGKEVAARALHTLSWRTGPFVPVNCSAIPESLAESQLFGHVPGAFTGASAHPGFFRAAHGGTLFLDEVGELSPAMQPRLLRVLEDHAVVPVGAVAPLRVDVRLIAATNRDLDRSVAAGTFRGDLYARLAEMVLPLPPLRDRREDILPLLRAALGPQAPPLSPDLIGALLLYPWPFNVREVFKLATELRIRGAVAAELTSAMLAGRPLSPAAAWLHVPVPPPRTTVPPGPAPAPAEARDSGPPPTREELLGLLKDHKGIVANLARDLGRSRRQVYRWLKQHDLDPEAFRG